MAAAMTVTKEQFRQAMGCFATGVTVVTVAREDGGVHGMTANAFCSVSLDPLLVLVCVDRRARTHPILHASEHFGINVLNEEQQSLATHYARPDRDDRGAERVGAKFAHTKRGTPLLAGCLGHLECRLVKAHEAGDHTIFIGQVELVTLQEGRPLLFYRGRYESLEEAERER